MTDIAIEPPRAHARIVYLGPVSPHWEIYFDHGDRTVIDEFRARALARLVLRVCERARSFGITGRVQHCRAIAHRARHDVINA